MVEQSVHLVIRGEVHGVGYRAWFKDLASGLALRGWVRNRRDGSVEAVVAGSTGSVERVISAAWQGPPASAVTGIAVTDATPPQHPDFSVLPTL